MTGVLSLVRVASLPGAEDPYWARVLTAAERAHAAGRERAVEHLGARAAAKHAAAHLLGLAGPADAEICRDPAGDPWLRWVSVTDQPQVGVSLTHAAGWAVALVWRVA